MQDYIFASESVSDGHPDKLCDIISDGLLDTFLSGNPLVHTAIETVATKNTVLIFGEISGANLSMHKTDNLVRNIIKDIGYEQTHFNWKTLKIKNYLHEQSRDIVQGIGSEGAGDQGIMFGYACSDTESFMPAPIYYAHQILKNLKFHRSSNLKNILGPDAKCQVAIQYVSDKPVKSHSIVLSTQHHLDYTISQIREIIRPIIFDTLPRGWMCEEDHLYINPAGSFVIGGPEADTGLTGRKIIVDTYGGAAPHGGGAFSGKDPSKVDRSAAYMARYLAKNIVAAGLAKKCTLQLSYAIGLRYPLSLYIDMHGTGKIEEACLASSIQKHFDLSPLGIRKYLNLNSPIYNRTASYGHFGREPDKNDGFSWERIDLIPFLNLLQI